MNFKRHKPDPKHDRHGTWQDDARRRRDFRHAPLDPEATIYRRHDPTDHACVGGVEGDRYPL